MNYEWGEIRVGVSNVEDENYVKLGRDEIVRVLLLGRHAGKI